MAIWQGLQAAAAALDQVLLGNPPCWHCGYGLSLTAALPLCGTCLLEATRPSLRPCPVCEDERGLEALCSGCLELRPAYRLARSVGPYAGPLGQAIRQLKYHGEKRWVEPLASLLQRTLNTVRPVDALLPVPMHPDRLRERGYNQCQLVGQALSRRTGVPLGSDWVRRTRPTASQSRLDRRARLTNVAGAFAANRRLEGRIAIIDDVLTTGATAHEMARVMLQAGAQEVIVLAVAREGGGLGHGSA